MTARVVKIVLFLLAFGVAGCDQGTSSEGDTKCGVARHKKRGRTRTSAFAFALAAIVFPLRRLTRPRR